MPNETPLMRAIAWLSAALKDRPEPRMKLIDEVSKKFNLSPLEEDYLIKNTPTKEEVRRS